MSSAGTAGGSGERADRRLDAIVVAVTAAVFARSIGFPFVNWDDYERIVDRPWVVEPFSRSLYEVLFTPELGYPQPLTALSQAWDWWVGGGAAWPFHLTNVVLHAVVALLVRRVARSYGVSPVWSTVAALVFALHPIVVEPVCWATGRKDLLAALGVLGGFVAYRRAARRWELPSGASAQVDVDRRVLGGMAGGFALAIGAKPVGIVLVPLVVADLLLSERRPGRRLRGALAVGAVLSAGVVVVSYRLHADISGVGAPRGLVESLAYASQHLALQLRNVAYPFDLAPLYFEAFPRDLASPWGLAGALAVALGVGVAIVARHRHRAVSVGAAWGLIAFAPSSGFVPLVRGPADSYFYLPWIGAALALGSLGDPLASRAWRVRMLVAAAAGIALAATVSWSSSERFSSSAALWRPMLTRYPEQPSSHQNYGDGLIADGRVDEAVPHLARALELSGKVPETPEGMETVALACAATGDAVCATRWWGEVARHFPLTDRRAWLLAGAAASAPDGPYVAEIRASRRRVHELLETHRAAPERAVPSELSPVERGLVRAALRSLDRVDRK